MVRSADRCSPRCWCSGVSPRPVRARFRCASPLGSHFRRWPSACSRRSWYSRLGRWRWWFWRSGRDAPDAHLIDHQQMAALRPLLETVPGKLVEGGPPAPRSLAQSREADSGEALRRVPHPVDAPDLAGDVAACFDVRSGAVAHLGECEFACAGRSRALDVFEERRPALVALVNDRNEAGIAELERLRETFPTLSVVSWRASSWKGTASPRWSISSSGLSGRTLPTGK